MVLEPIRCPVCNGVNVTKHGKTENEKQRFACKDIACNGKTFILNYSEKGCLPEVKRQIIDMALNGSGIRDTSRVLHISTATVTNELKKKESELNFVNQVFLESRAPESLQVVILKAEIDPTVMEPEKIEKIHGVAERKQAAEVDEMWSYVGRKKNQRWLWHAIDHASGVVLAYVLGERQDNVFLGLKKLLTPFGITRFYTDDWGAYDRHLDPDKHVVGKQNTQTIERKHLTLRTRIKRLARKTLCFSKSTQMHDIVIGLFVNRYEFAVPV
jgi:insertion element IS1 protein InsB